MFKQLFEFVQHVLFLQRDVQRLKEDVAELERELHENNEVLRTVLFEIQRLAEIDALERQKLELKIENALLRNRSLPPAKRPKQ